MTRRQSLALLLGAVLAGALVLSGCAPAVHGSGPAIAVLNGPSDGRIAGSAELLQSGMARQGPLHFHFVASAAMRFAEGHNDFHHDRALTSAGRVARSFGAPYAVLIGASTLDRSVTESKNKDVRTVTITLRMEATVVDAHTDQAVAHVSSVLYTRSRRESTASPLPPLQHDPVVLTLRDQGVDAIAPAVVGAVWNALDIHPSRPGG